MGDELHHVLVFPLNPGRDLADVREAFRRDSGPPPFDEERGDGTAVLDGGMSQVTELELEEGRHVLVCFIPDRAGGPPHALKGMLAEVEVR